MKGALLEVTGRSCRRIKGPARQSETQWWMMMLIIVLLGSIIYWKIKNKETSKGKYLEPKKKTVCFLVSLSGQILSRKEKFQRRYVEGWLSGMFCV